MALRKAIFLLSGRGLERVVKKVYSKSFHARSLFASIATGMERTWYDFGPYGSQCLLKDKICLL